jgi:hypothetical protein
LISVSFSNCAGVYGIVVIHHAFIYTASITVVFSSARSLLSLIDPVELTPHDHYQDVATEFTCRWTNCGEVCPSGFNPVPRNYGRRGEMM